jgi:hypothetical protein
MTDNDDFPDDISLPRDQVPKVSSLGDGIGEADELCLDRCSTYSRSFALMHGHTLK